MCVIILLVVPLLNLFFDKGNGLKFHLGGLSPTLSMLSAREAIFSISASSKTGMGITDRSGGSTCWMTEPK